MAVVGLGEFSRNPCPEARYGDFENFANKPCEKCGLDSGLKSLSGNFEIVSKNPCLSARSH